MLWIGFLGAFLAVTSRLQSTAAVTSARFVGDRIAARALLNAGFEVGSFGLGEDGTRVVGSDRFRLRFSTGEVYGERRNEGAFVNLNYAPASLIAAAFRATGADPAVANRSAVRIVEAREDALTGSAVPRSGGPRPEPAVAAFASTTEALTRAGVPQQLWRPLSRYITTFGTSAGISFTASPLELARRVPGITPGLFDRIRASRESNLPDPELTRLLGDAAAFFVETPANVWRIDLEARLANGHRENAQAVVTTIPGDRRAHRVLVWRSNADLDGSGLP